MQNFKGYCKAHLSPAEMFHESWLIRWKKEHGDKPLEKPILKDRMEIGKVNIAVPWEQLPKYFKDKYDKMYKGVFCIVNDMNYSKELLEEKLKEMSQKSIKYYEPGLVSLDIPKDIGHRPIRYLYDIVHGQFYPAFKYLEGEEAEPETILDHIHETFPNLATSYYKGASCTDRCYIGNSEIKLSNGHLPIEIFNRHYTTKLFQKLLSSNPNYSEFIKVDINSVTSQEQIQELDETLYNIANTSEVKEKIKELQKYPKIAKSFEKKIFEELSTEVQLKEDKFLSEINEIYSFIQRLEAKDLSYVLSDLGLEDWARKIYEGYVKEYVEETLPKHYTENYYFAGNYIPVTFSKFCEDLRNKGINSELSNIIPTFQFDEYAKKCYNEYIMNLKKEISEGYRYLLKNLFTSTNSELNDPCYLIDTNTASTRRALYLMQLIHHRSKTPNGKNIIYPEQATYQQLLAMTEHLENLIGKAKETNSDLDKEGQICISYGGSKQIDSYFLEDVNPEFLKSSMKGYLRYLNSNDESYAKNFQVNENPIVVKCTPRQLLKVRIRP